MGVIIRQGFKATLSNYIGMGLGFLSLVLLFPLFFSPDDLGAVRIFIELGTVLSSFALIGTHYSINRFFPYFRTSDQKHHGFFFWVLIFPLIGFIILLISLYFGGNTIFTFINPNALKHKELLPILIVLVFVILYQTVSEVSCSNHGRTAVPNFMREVVMRGFVILSGLTYYLGFTSFEQTMWLIVLSYAIALSGNLWFLAKITKINLRPDMDFIRNHPKLIKEAFQFSSYLFFAGLASLLYTKMDLFMISAIQKDLTEVAIYSIGFNLASFIEIPKRTILQIATPIFANLMKQENYKEVEALNKKNGSNQLLISGILFFMIWLNIDNLYDIMPTGDLYSKGKWVVFFIGISKLIDAVACGNSPIIANSKFYSLSVISIIVALVSAFTFNYYFITEFGLIGGALSSILVIMAVNTTHLIVLQAKLSLNPFHKDQLKILAVLVLFFALSFTGHWLANPYLDAIIRSTVFGAAIILVFFKLKLSEDFNQLLKSNLPFLNRLS
jgi:O-antigen/teichoic acid export membrane protein